MLLSGAVERGLGVHGEGVQHSRGEEVLQTLLAVVLRVIFINMLEAAWLSREPMI
jgi:hypothetical protein